MSRNRLRPKQGEQRPSHWQITTRLATDGATRQRHPTDVDMGDGLVYERRHDQIRLETGPGSELVIAPGRRFAEALARGFTTMPDTPAGGRVELLQCGVCFGDVLIAKRVDTGDSVFLERKPSPNGIWLFVNDRDVRSLRPHEDPPGPTYATHVCRQETAE